MAVLRNDPYLGCNFVVEIDGDAHDAFLTVDLPAAEIDEVEYREGGDQRNEPRKQPGLTRYGRLVLTRGLTGATDLYEWWSAARDGQPVDRQVVVVLLDEGRNPVLAWRLLRAFPVTYEVSTLDATVGEPVTETLGLAFDRLEVE